MPTKLDDRQNHLRDVARSGRLAKVGYCAIITGVHGLDEGRLAKMTSLAWQTESSHTLRSRDNLPPLERLNQQVPQQSEPPFGISSTSPSQSPVQQPTSLAGIPEEAHEYQLGSRSALDWLVDRYEVKPDSKSGITSDPNDWSIEIGDPSYILDLVRRVTTVSIRTVDIVKSLPELPI